MVKAEKLEEVKAKAEDLAVEKILNIIASPSEDSGELINKSANSIDSEKDNDYREKTREWLREKIKKGEMDDREIEFTAGSSASNTLSSLGIDGIGMQIVGPINLDSMGFNFQDILSQFVPKKKKKRKATIKEAKAIFAQEEADKLIDMEAIVNEAIKRVQEMGIVFIDEIDKIVGNGKGHGPEVSREGVQRDLLPIVEGSTVSTKYGPVKTDHILFIASGAFHISKPSDLIPELQGRFPIRVELKSLTEDDFVKILTITENALLKQYKALLETEGIEVEFAEDGIREIAKAAAYVNSQVENIGARRLQTILSSLLDDILFNAPDRIEKNKFLIDADFVKSKISNLTQNKDLSRYIL
jgi:ATP-dependent HslUV protease ATP-binding subunit HslU